MMCSVYHDIAYGSKLQAFHGNRPSTWCDTNLSAVQRARKQSALWPQREEDPSSYTWNSGGKPEGEYLTVNEPVEQSTVPKNVAVSTCDDVRLPVFNVRPSSCCRRKRDDVRYMRSPPMGAIREPLKSNQRVEASTEQVVNAWFGPCGKN